LRETRSQNAERRMKNLENYICRKCWSGRISDQSSTPRPDNVALNPDGIDPELRIMKRGASKPSGGGSPRSPFVKHFRTRRESSSWYVEPGRFRASPAGPDLNLPAPVAGVAADLPPEWKPGKSRSVQQPQTSGNVLASSSVHWLPDLVSTPEPPRSDPASERDHSRCANEASQVAMYVRHAERPSRAAQAPLCRQPCFFRSWLRCPEAAQRKKKTDVTLALLSRSHGGDP